jgi:hypothetical protein
LMHFWQLSRLQGYPSIVAWLGRRL